jgi:hypothetical protein
MAVEAPFMEAMIGKTVSRIWRGAGSAIFIEFGELEPRMLRRGEPGNPRGEISLMVEWSWRIEGPNSILVGSWSDEGQWTEHFDKLVGSTVKDVILLGALPEIQVSFSNLMQIASFMTAEGQPAWSILTREPSIGSLCVKNGKLNVEPRDL